MEYYSNPKKLIKLLKATIFYLSKKQCATHIFKCGFVTGTCF